MSSKYLVFFSLSGLFRGVLRVPGEKYWQNKTFEVERSLGEVWPTGYEQFSSQERPYLVKRLSTKIPRYGGLFRYLCLTWIVGMPGSFSDRSPPLLINNDFEQQHKMTHVNQITIKSFGSYFLTCIFIFVHISCPIYL